MSSSGTSAASSAGVMRGADPKKIKRVISARRKIKARSATIQRKAALVDALEADVTALCAQLGPVPPHVRVVKTQVDNGPLVPVRLEHNGPQRERPWRANTRLHPPSSSSSSAGTKGGKDKMQTRGGRRRRRVARAPPRTEKAARGLAEAARARERAKARALAEEKKAKQAVIEAEKAKKEAKRKRYLARREWERTKQAAFADTLLAKEYRKVAPGFGDPVKVLGVHPDDRDLLLVDPAVFQPAPDNAPDEGEEEEHVVWNGMTRADAEDARALIERADRIQSARQQLEELHMGKAEGYAIRVSAGVLEGVRMGSDVLGDLSLFISYGDTQQAVFRHPSPVSPGEMDWSACGMAEFYVDLNQSIDADIFVAVYEHQHPSDDALYPVVGPTSFGVGQVSSVAIVESEHPRVPLMWYHPDVGDSAALDRPPATLDLAVSVVPLPLKKGAASKAAQLDALLQEYVDAIRTLASRVRRIQLELTLPQDGEGGEGDEGDEGDEESPRTSPSRVSFVGESVARSGVSDVTRVLDETEVARVLEIDTEEYSGDEGEGEEGTGGGDGKDGGDGKGGGEDGEDGRDGKGGGGGEGNGGVGSTSRKGTLGGLRGLDHVYDIGFELEWDDESCGRITCVSPGAEMIAAGGDDGRVRLWQVHSETVVSHSSSEPTQKKHSFEAVAEFTLGGTGRVSPVTSILLSTPTRRIVAGYGNGQLRIFVAEKEGECLQLVSLGEPTTMLAGDERSMLTGSASGALQLWTTGRVERIGTLAPSRAGGPAVVCGYVSGDIGVTGDAAGVLSIWSLSRNAMCLQSQIQAHRRPMTSLCVGPLGPNGGLDTVATCGADGLMKVWDVPHGSSMFNYVGVLRGPVKGVLFDGEHLVSIDGADPRTPHAQIKLWSTESVPPIVEWDVLQTDIALLAASSKFIVFVEHPELGALPSSTLLMEGGASFVFDGFDDLTPSGSAADISGCSSNTASTSATSGETGGEGRREDGDDGDDEDGNMSDLTVIPSVWDTGSLSSRLRVVLRG